MNLKRDIAEIVSAQYIALIARRAEVQAKIAELVKQVQEIALHLEGLQQESRGNYLELVSESLGLKPAAAADEARKLRTLAKRPVDKAFYVVNGMLPAPARKTPKASKLQSPIVKVGNLQAEILAAKERGLNDQELAVIRGIIDKLRKELG